MIQVTVNAKFILKDLVYVITDPEQNIGIITGYLMWVLGLTIITILNCQQIKKHTKNKKLQTWQ